MAKHSKEIETQLALLGKRIRTIRKSKNSNYEHWAYEHGFNRSSVSRFEAGEDIRFSSLLRILEAFDMSLQEFFSEGFEEEE